MELQGIRILSLHLIHRSGNRFLERKTLVLSPEQSSQQCGVGNWGWGTSHLFLLLQLTGLSLQALQLLLRLLEFS